MKDTHKNLLKILALSLLPTLLILLPFFLRVKSFWSIPLPSANGMATIVSNYDGPLFLVVAKTLYNKSLIEGNFSLSLPTEYYAAHFPLFPALIRVFSVALGWLPSGGRGPTSSLLGVEVSFLSWDGMKFLLLPALTLALHNIALVMRITEASTREVAHQEYVRFARAKGVGPVRLMFRHIAPNVMIPVVTVLGLEFAHLIAFSLITETIFAWPGMGKLIIDSLLQLDRPVVVAYLMVVLLLYVLINFTVDVLYLVLDPRLRTKAA